ncbi:hypothetical protein ACIRRA_43805 [Nocardia sp. NPDC101769]|uniref:hypothetical protein n=1 Tax=Nocardia sp. NPDC101769 TaxID=3364333 RepID=UPI0037F110E4
MGPATRGPPDVLAQYQQIRSEVVALLPAVEALDRNNADDYPVIMLYGYLDAASRATIDDEMRAMLETYADLEARLVAACDQFRSARCLDDYTQVSAIALLSVRERAQSLEADSTQRWVLNRLYAYVSNLCDRERGKAMQLSLNSPKNRRKAIDHSIHPSPGIHRARSMNRDHGTDLGR